jgi:hypothetical protein
MMGRMEYIRNDFKKKIDKLTKEGDISILNEFFAPPFPEDEIITNWVSEDLKKIMRVQEACEEDEFEFDFFTGKAGENNAYDDLCIVAKSVNEKAGLIYDIYKRWFVENNSPSEIIRELEDIASYPETETILEAV